MSEDPSNTTTTERSGGIAALWSHMLPMHEAVRADIEVIRAAYGEGAADLAERTYVTTLHTSAEHQYDAGVRAAVAPRQWSPAESGLAPEISDEEAARRSLDRELRG